MGRVTSKRVLIIKFPLQSQFERLLYQTLCVFSKMKDIQHIKRDFHSSSWVMPQGVGLWGAGLPGGINFSEHGHVAN